MKRSRVIGFFAFLLTLSLTQYLAYQQYLIVKENETKKVKHELYSLSDRVEAMLKYSMSATRILGYLVEKYGVPEDFDSVAYDILDSHKYIDALQLTRKGVITHVYPVQGNEPALGFDVLRDSSVSGEAMKAIERKELFFAGPLNLKQGGKGVVGRLPIFKDGEFFGFSVVIIKLSTLLDAFGMQNQNHNFKYQLSKINPVTRQQEFFLKDEINAQEEASVFIEVPDGAWMLYVSSASGSIIYYSVYGFVLGGILFSFILGVFVFQWVEKPEKLKKLVKEMTSQLLATQENSKTTLDRISDAFVSFDNDWRCTYINQRATKLFGLKSGQVIGMNIRAKFPELSGSPWYDAFEKAMDLQEYVSVEFFFSEKSKWLESHFYPSVDGVSIFIRDITEQKTAKERLASSEKYFRALIENSANAIVLMDANGGVRYQSPSTIRISGYSLSDMLELDGVGLVHPDDRDAVVRLFEKVLQSPGRVFHTEYRFKHKSGRYIWLEGYYINLLEDVNIGAIVYNYYDVTERVKTQQAISYEKYLSDSIINSLPGIFYLYDRYGRFYRWNKNFEKISEYTSEEVSQMHPLDFFDEGDKEVMREKIESVFIKGKDDIESYFYTKSERKIPYYFSGCSICIEGREYLIGMGIDITQRLEAEKKALAEYREKETVLNRINDSVISLNNSWEYTFLNDAALRMHPLGKDKTIGKEFLEVHPELEGGPVYKMLKQAMQAMEVMETEGYYSSLQLWFSAKAYPSEDGLTVFFRDISEKKKAEQEILNLINNLKEKNRNLQQFSYIVSHDLRAPLANILGLAGVINESETVDKICVQAMADEASRLDQVVRDMNSVVSVREMVAEKMETVSFKEELDWVVGQLSVDIEASSASILEDLKVAHIDTLKNYIRNILLYLLTNAIMYRYPQREPKIKVKTVYDGAFIRLSVEDNGCGIDLQKYGDKIFGLYQRFHSGGNAKGGVNMVKTMTGALGGYVEVVSDINEGSIFKVYLPLNYKKLK
ncbi:PAS domain S-box protein [Fulvivirga sp. 29W222]|uniref:histidine kinase n=1 Tax=Fulvivirga marina TaxID=2494733 RepID=A0A937G1Q7_9BACT|nr:PAS domain S-box protein [Fulvivirga marina]MBL6448888.1 PAS domain S-box protein [Fulvivirga marina]